MVAGDVGRGFFITLEGPDGSGKSTQAARLAWRLREQGRPVTVVREPGGTALGERIRQLLLYRREIAFNPVADALLFNAARAQLVTEAIRPALEAGEIVVCVRFADSTLAYQGYGSGIDLAALRSLATFATGGLVPDLTLLLDVPPAVGLRRKAGGRVPQPTRFEADFDAAFHQRVRAGFLVLAAEDPGRWRVVDASRSRQVVGAAIAAAVEALLAAGLRVNRTRRPNA